MRRKPLKSKRPAAARRRPGAGRSTLEIERTARLRLERRLRQTKERDARAMAALQTAHDEMQELVQRRMDDLRLATRRLRSEISDRLKTEEALLESEGRFRDLAESIEEVFWLTDWDAQRVVYVSPGYESIWGRSARDLYANPTDWIEAIHVEDRERVENSFFRSAATDGFDEEYRIVRPDGSIRWIRDRGFPIEDEAGRVNRIAGVAEDVTARRRTEAALRRSERLASVGILGSGIAREMSNPIGAILLAARTALACRSDPAATRSLEQCLETIVRNAERCSQIVSNLRQLSSRDVSAKGPHDLNVLIRRAHDLVAQRNHHLGSRIELELAADLPTLECNAAEIEQVFLNLLQNAVESGEEPARVTVRSERDAAGARVSIRDDGRGMSEAEKRHLFDPFYTTGRSAGKPGLGLSVAHRIVVEHGGRIEIESEPRRGTTVTLTLPTGAVAGVAPLLNGPGPRDKPRSRS